MPTVHKVTCFITRQTDHGSDILLFRHPIAGVQIPAGTVDLDEDLEPAARREAFEESGLVGLELVKKLGEAEDPPEPGYAVLAVPTVLYSRPSTDSYDWVHLRIGLTVELLRHASGFTQVRFEEPEHMDHPQIINYSLTGWVLDEALTTRRIRHYYLFNAVNSTPDSWKVFTDHHDFHLFWASLSSELFVIPQQAHWLKWLAE